MYSAWQRASVLGGYFMYGLMATLAIIAALNYAIPTPEPSVKLSVDRVNLKRGLEDYYTTKNAWLADFYLSLEADFTKLFHWNTKQLVLYMTIEYSTPENPQNSLVIWDRIIQQKDFKRIDLHGFRSKGSEVQVKLYWNTVYWVGILQDSQQGVHVTKVPEVKAA